MADPITSAGKKLKTPEESYREYQAMKQQGKTPMQIFLEQRYKFIQTGVPESEATQLASRYVGTMEAIREIKTKQPKAVVTAVGETPEGTQITFFGSQEELKQYKGGALVVSSPAKVETPTTEIMRIAKIHGQTQPSGMYETKFGKYYVSEGKATLVERPQVDLSKTKVQRIAPIRETSAAYKTGFEIEAEIEAEKKAEEAAIAKYEEYQTMPALPHAALVTRATLSDIPSTLHFLTLKATGEERKAKVVMGRLYAEQEEIEKLGLAERIGMGELKSATQGAVGLAAIPLMKAGATSLAAKSIQAGKVLNVAGLVNLGAGAYYMGEPLMRNEPELALARAAYAGMGLLSWVGTKIKIPQKVIVTTSKSKVLEMSETKSAIEVKGKIVAEVPGKEAPVMKKVGKWEFVGEAEKVAESGEIVYYKVKGVRITDIYPKYQKYFKVTKPYELILSKAGAVPTEVSVSTGEKGIYYKLPEAVYSVSKTASAAESLRLHVIPSLTKETQIYLEGIYTPLGTSEEEALAWKVGEVKGTGAAKIFGREIKVTGAKFYRGISGAETTGAKSVGFAKTVAYETGGKIVQYQNLDKLLTTGVVQTIKPPSTSIITPTLKTPPLMFPVQPSKQTTAKTTITQKPITIETQTLQIPAVKTSQEAQKIVTQEAAFFSKVGTIAPKEEKRVVKIGPQITEKQAEEILEKYKEIAKQETKLKAQKEKPKPQPKQLPQLEKESYAHKELMKLAQLPALALRQEKMQKKAFALAQRYLTEKIERRKTIPTALIPSITIPSLFGFEEKGKEKVATIKAKKAAKVMLPSKDYFEKVWPVLTEPKELFKLFGRKRK